MRPTRSKSMILLFALVLGLTSVGWAAPRVALVKAICGTIHLDAQLVKAPTLAEEGQLLELTAGAEAVLTPIGGKGTVSLKGPRTFRLTKENLRAEASGTPQRSLEVARDLGNFSRGAAEVVRDADSDRVVPVGLKVGTAVNLGPGAGYRLPIEADPKLFESGGWLVIELMELLPADRPGQRLVRRFLAEEVWEESASGLHLQSSKIGPARRYLLRMSYRTSESDSTHTVRERRWRLLTPEEAHFLQERDQELRSEVKARGSVAPILLLAQLYSDFDQIEETFELLLEAHGSPEVQGDPELRESVESQLLDLAELLDRPFSV